MRLRPLFDGLPDRQDAACRFNVHVLDQAGVAPGDGLASRNRLIESGDNSLGALNFFGTRREDVFAISAMQRLGAR